MSVSTEVHFEGKIAQKAIIKENKVLLVRDPQMDEVIWEIPGERMNIDEEPREAVVREIREELGIEIVVGPVLHMEQFTQGNEGRRAFVIVYECQMQDVHAEIHMSQAEVCEIAWVSAKELSKYPLFPEFKSALDYYFANQG
ncbi:NUDIX hydrolase [Patescibacteria group bacterium]|nr:NUDIX hydrolase [Patescibacteria group bacterium]